MNGIRKAIYTIHYTDSISAENNALTRLHPLTKLLVTFGFLVVVVSFHKYDLANLLVMSIFPISIMPLANISVYKTIKRIRGILLITSLPALANLFYDKTVFFQVYNIVITGGMISMTSLLVKGILSIVASFILIATTPIEKICYALRLVHIPQKLVTVILLIYRYIIVLLKEAERITQAYTLRAPGQKGIHVRVWGTLAGQLLLRSSDRAQTVYESMLLRGFNGEFNMHGSRFDFKNTIITCGMLLGIFMLRFFPLSEWIGGFFI